MPGVVMDNANVEGSARWPRSNEAPNGSPGSFGDSMKPDQTSSFINGAVRANGTGREFEGLSQHAKARNSNSTEVAPEPFELLHITEGFYPLGVLVHRAVQQCWNDLSELITELAAIHVPSDYSAASLSSGKPSGNLSPENVQKKMRILDFAHAKRAEFIKLLVLSQWSRQAAEVRQLIDVSSFIRTRQQAYDVAVQHVGGMKRGLVLAQVANPDLRTALEVLAKGRVRSLPDLGYRTPKPLNARTALQKLHKINRIIQIRLTLHDQVPGPLQNYRVHDGRVTFIVPGEFELDLSVAKQAESSQFFFVDIRFLFSPSSPIPKGRIFDELDAQVNRTLMNDGLLGCFHLLHGLVLTNKINSLFRQATDLARGLWSGALRIELLRRTLVVQYWPSRAGPKSWLEIGVQRGQRIHAAGDADERIPRLCLRWKRDGRQANSDAIQFDSVTLSMERILRSVIALHTAHLLSTAYSALKKNLLYRDHVLTLRVQLSPEEPGDCHLDVQLTSSRYLRVSVEPLSGSITLSGTPSVLERLEIDRPSKQSATDELLSRVTRLRCISAVDEIESGTKVLGLQSVNPRSLGLNARELFPSGAVRSVFFTHRIWDRRWVAVATSSMDGDNWWLVQVPPVNASRGAASYILNGIMSGLSSPHLVSSTLNVPQHRFRYTAGAQLVHGLTGILAIYANARCLAGLPGAQCYPPLGKLRLGSNFDVPDLYFRYKTAMLPTALRIALPSGPGRGCYLQDTIRLSFHGVDRQGDSVVLIAYGTLRSRVKSLLPLVSKMDPSLIMQDKGGGFALRLLVAAGHSAIFGLFARLQQLECALSIFQSLVQRGLVPQSLSLSQVTFSYGPDERLSGYFGIDVAGPSLSELIDTRHVLSKVNSFFQLRLRVGFNSPSPHRRISESLTVALNDDFASTGVDSILGIMSHTLHLLYSFDHITASPEQSSQTLVHITVRNPTVFQLHYPRLETRFRLSLGRRNDHPVWVLEDSSPGGSSDNNPVFAFVKDKVYNSREERWQGLGNAALADIDKVGNLLSGLQECLRSYHLEPETKEGEGKPGQQSATQGLSHGEQAVVPAKPANASPQKPGRTSNTDIITID